MSEEKRVKRQKRLTGPTAKDFVQINRKMTRVWEYVLLGTSTTNLKGRNDAIEGGNATKFAYMQGALDVCLDIKNLLEGMQLVVYPEQDGPTKHDQQGYQ